MICQRAGGERSARMEIGLTRTHKRMNPSKAFYQAFQSGSRLRDSKTHSDRNKGKICGTNVSEGVSPATGFIVGWGLGGVVDMTSVLSSEGNLAGGGETAGTCVALVRSLTRRHA
ncbi:hypothetical protein N1851_002720 [Merluccius polli]|uniref:Uncharacterized protein n=1 Tax=Merluccius polli TaxID=89951 RepID=A0AA47N9K3_MERPO|nr:hypothetical protein N1851_002720 [Merluccius polli]